MKCLNKIVVSGLIAEAQRMPCSDGVRNVRIKPLLGEEQQHFPKIGPER